MQSMQAARWETLGRHLGAPLSHRRRERERQAGAALRLSWGRLCGVCSGRAGGASHHCLHVPSSAGMAPTCCRDPSPIEEPAGGGATLTQGTRLAQPAVACSVGLAAGKLVARQLVSWDGLAASRSAGSGPHRNLNRPITTLARGLFECRHGREASGLSVWWNGRQRRGGGHPLHLH